MILHEVGVESFRCFRQPYRLGELDPGINLICGPNEAGKSTLFAALAHGLLTHHRSTGRSIEELRPWGTELSPRVRLLIEVGGRRWRIIKRFLEGRACRIEREEGDAFLPVAEGDAAEERLRQLLGSRGGSRGAGRLAQWSVAELLWVPQGGSGQLPAVAEELRARIQAGIGGISLSARETELLRRLEAAHCAVFQEKRGGVRAGSELARLSRQRDELAAAVARFEQQRAQLAQAASELGEVSEAQSAIARRRDELAAEQQALLEASAQLRRHREQLERAQAEAGRARSAFEAVDIFRERLGALQRKLREQDLTIEALTRRQTSLERELDELLLRYTGQHDEASALRAEIARLERRESWERARKEQVALESRLRALEAVDAEQRSLQAEETEAPAPAADVLEEAERLWESRARAHAAGTLSVRVEALAELRVRGEGGELQLRPGELHEQQGLGAAELTLVDLARVSVTLPGYDLTAARAAERAFRELLEAHRAEDLADLRDRHVRAEARRRRLENLRDEAARLLGPGERLEDLRIALHGLRRRAAGLQGELAVGIETGFPDAGDLQAALDEARRRLERQTEALNVTQASLEDLRRQANELAVERQGSEVARRAARADLDDIATRYGSAEEMLGRWREARQQFDMAIDRVAELNASAPSTPVDTEERIARLAAELSLLERKDRELRDRQVTAETRLQDGQSAGLYDQLVASREDLVRAERDLAREERRARAARLLLALARRAHAELSSGLAAPLAAELGACLERVSGRAGRQVHVAEDLALQSLSIPGGEGQAVVEPDALSGGTQEQLGLLYRLALGRLLAGSERLTVVLDDPLGETDPHRQSRLLELLDRESERLQILILTCHPERYAPLPRRRTFELPPI